MKYLPIFQELFGSDSIFIMLVGFILALFIGIRINNTRKNIIGLIFSFILYAVCELISNISPGYLITVTLLFIGTIAIGGIAGFTLSAVTAYLKKR
ncbi:MAG: hypothetical protein HFH48_04670 [Lachnospiraceae bacterium]|nr:hypothetical protein [Lachnospiraceae bacterium]